MEIELLKEKWDEVCYHLADTISPGINENIYEQKVLRILETMGWREYVGEIKLKPSLQIGAKNFIEPDIVLYERGRPVVVVEVKRPSELLELRQFKNQLISYMRQLRVDFGLLVGNQIYIIYDGNLKNQHEALILKEILFQKGSEDGCSFVAAFNREAFLNKEYDKYLKQWLDDYNIEMRKNELRQFILSDALKLKIEQLLIDEFNDLGKDIVQSVFKEFTIKVSQRKPDVPKPPPVPVANEDPGEEFRKYWVVKKGASTERVAIVLAKFLEDGTQITPEAVAEALRAKGQAVPNDLKDQIRHHRKHGRIPQR